MQQLVVRENGAQLPSQHILMYNSTTQVGRAPGRGGWEWGTVGWESVNLGGRGWKVERGMAKRGGGCGKWVSVGRGGEVEWGKGGRWASLGGENRCFREERWKVE